MKKLQVAILMESTPQERKKTHPHLLEVVEIPEFTLKDLALRQRHVKEKVTQMITDRGYQVRSLSVVVDNEDYELTVVVQAPIFGSTKKKPVRRDGPQGGHIGRNVR
jgi:hypothetical protein